LSLNDREIDFDLVEATGVERCMNEDYVGPSVTQPVGGLLPSMSRAVVHDPKDAASRLIRLLPHDFAHKPIHGSNSTFDFTAAEDSCSMDISGCQIGPGPQAEVLMLEVRGRLGAGGNVGCFRHGNQVPRRHIMNVNKVTLAGRLTRDPETIYTNSGTAITDISLAVSRSTIRKRARRRMRPLSSS